jgi:hypothetical protein
MAGLYCQPSVKLRTLMLQTTISEVFRYSGIC